MIYHRRRGVVSYVLKPFLLLLVLVGVFGLVWLRSSIVTAEYAIGALEKRKAEAMKEAQALRAEMASLLSLKEVDERRLALAFPDRERVFYVKRDEGGIPYTASLKGERR